MAFIELFDYQGVQFFCEFPQEDAIQREMSRTHMWEPWQLDAYDRVMTLGMGVLVDVGANVGVNSLYVARRYPDSTVYAFEPSGANFRSLTTNVACAGASNVRASRVAVADRAGEMVMIGTGGAHVHGLDATEEDERLAGETVPCITIDEFVASNEITSIECLKIDVESFENEVLHGASSALASGLVRFVVLAVSIGDIIAYRQEPVARILEERLELLRAVFPHIYVIMRNGELVEVGSVARLRFLLHEDYPVADLLCSRTALSSRDAFPNPARATTLESDGLDSGNHSFRRWPNLGVHFSRSNIAAGSRSGMLLEHLCPRQHMLEIDCVGSPEHSIWAYIEDQVVEIKMSSGERSSVAVDLRGNQSAIYLESSTDYSTRGAECSVDVTASLRCDGAVVGVWSAN